MALHGWIARHAGSFGASAVWNTATAYSSARPSPSQLRNDFSYHPDRGRHPVSSVFHRLIADERAERRA
jgi:hypothetical protein